MYFCNRNSANGSLAQLNRASDYGSEGCGFESRGSHIKENPESKACFQMQGLFFMCCPARGRVGMDESQFAVVT